MCKKYKKGNILKGLSLKKKIIISVVCVLTAILCVGLFCNKKQIETARALNPIFEAELSTGHKQKFSAKFDGDIIFSAEKVLMDVNGNYETPLADARKFYQRKKETVASGEARYFYDYYYNDGTIGEDKKYVIEDGSFVMLNNLVDSSSGTPKYYYSNNRNLSEVVMLSFGNYIYGNNGVSDTIDYADEDTTANIRDLRVKAFKNTESSDGLVEIKDLPPARNVGIYLDFLYIIPQEPGNEGFYRFEFTYLTNVGEARSGVFEFYLIYETSYSEEITFQNSENKYYVQPTLGWVDGSNTFAKTTSESYVRYNAGKDGIDTADNTVSYPTITYDYSRYSLNYKHTANDVVTNYVYIYKPDEDKIVYTATSGNVTRTEEKLLKYEVNNRKLVTIMLTEPGLYEFEYDYIYTLNPDIEIGLEVEPLDSLYIHGADLVYSKYNYHSAKMRNLTISTNEKDKVDLIVPNAFALDNTDNKDIEDYKNSAIGFVYNTINSSSARVGDIDIIRSNDTLLNNTLKQTDKKISSQTYYEYIINSSNTNNYLHNANFNYNLVKSGEDWYYDKNNNGIKDNLETESYGLGDPTSDLSKVLSSINYPKTNQGSLWFTMNDSYSDSFYFYSTEKITDETKLYTEVKNSSGAITKYQHTRFNLTTETSFNQIGYYLVFLKVQPKGTEDGKPNVSDIYSYYQIFAFEYSTSTVNINVREEVDGVELENEKVVGSEKYTRENVVASWLEPGVFERKLSAKVYTTNNASDSIETIVRKNNSYTIENGDTTKLIGRDIAKVEEGSWAKLLIEVKSEGDSATYKIFTIDRQNITGVEGYVVAKKYAGNTFYYTYDIDSNGNKKRIDNGVTDSFATLNWNKKASGAKITVKYTITEFVKDSYIDPSFDANGDWITTNYKLGETVGSYDLTEVINQSYLQSSSVIKDHGLHIFTLTDDAGNSCKYALVIDRTENFFYIDSTPNDKIDNGEFFASNSSLIYSDNISYNVAKYKAFELNTSNSEVANFLTAIKDKTLADFGYYVGANSNYSNLKDIFAYNSSNGKHYLTIKNNTVDIYNNYGKRISSNANFSGDIKYNPDDEGTSTIVSMFIKGENHRYSSSYKAYDDTKSKLTIEINTDNAKGTVIYSSAVMSSPTDEDYKLDTGKVAGGSFATNAEHVGFHWNIGIGTYEVSEVYYQFYELSTTYDANTSDEDGNTYFYQKLGNRVDIYKNGAFNETIGAKNLNDGRGFIQFGRTSATAEGLYAVTRIYKNELAADDKDSQVLTYYFIVDRKGIIQNGVGENIHFELLEETPFNEFSSFEGTSAYIGEDINEYFPIYLSTTKLPATLHIPTGKYFYGNLNQTTGDYFAGRLNFSLYFLDTEKQLGDYVDGKPITELLFKGNIDATQDGYYSINLKNNLADYNYKDKFIVTDGGVDWLYLPGVYVVVITDNIKNGTNEHVNRKIIGLEITKGTNPTIDFKTGYDEDNLVKQRPEFTTSPNFRYSVTTSEEFVSLTLPSYKEDETKQAQVDLNYLVVEQYIDGTKQKDYINYQYTYIDGINLIDPDNTNLVKNNPDENGNLYRTIFLDTMLRKAGEVDKANLDRELYYLVTVRYKLYGNDKVNEEDKFINCYTYYDGNGDPVKFYYTTYKIIIDRQAPSNNINNLLNGYSDNSNSIAKDNLVEDYNNEHSSKLNTPINTMFENGYHDIGNGKKYYTMQYSAFYREKEDNHRSDLSLLYALNVKADTYFNTADIYKVLYKEINPESNFNLTMPIVESNYTYTVTDFTNKSTYSAILQAAEVNKFYEIVELDNAGNATQYIIYYYNAEPNLPLTFNIKHTNNANDSVEQTIFNSEDINLTLLQISGNSKVENKYGYFFKVELFKNETSIQTILTNFTTQFNAISTTLANKITQSGKGFYTIVLTSSLTRKSATISLYANSEENTINAQKLIDVNNRKIDLYRANYMEEGVPYYAKTIEIISGSIKNIYKAAEFNISGMVSKYTREDSNEDIALTWDSADDKTFKIIITDIFDNKDYANFNTITGFEGFYSVSFAGSGNYYYDENHDIYYGYTDATLKYNTTIVTSFTIKVNNIPITSSDYIKYGIEHNQDTNTFKLKAPYNTITNLGDKYSFEITFYEEGTEGETYNIVLDTDIPKVSLRDFSTYENKTMKVQVNVAEDDLDKFVSDTIIPGVLNLSWSEPNNEYFTYTYTLRELNSKTERTLTDGHFVISEGGTYQVVISVFSIDGLYLGNKVYTFTVAGNNELIYYVQYQGLAIDSNSNFKLRQVEGYENLYKNMVNAGDIAGENNIPTTNLPLYVIKEVDNKIPVDVVINEDLVTNKPKETRGVIENKNSNYTFYFYQVKTATNSKFFGILVVKESESFVSDVQVGGNNVTALDTIFTLANKDKDYQFHVNANYFTDLTDYLLSRNSLVVEMYYNSSKEPTKKLVAPVIESGTPKTYSSNFEYAILGNGYYTFVFKDLAGNVHFFGDNSVVQVTVLREVVVFINDSAPIENAYYNDAVEMKIYASAQYDIGSVKVNAELNGKPYTLTSSQPYTFRDYGNYKITINATYKGTVELEKIINFTILNPNEVMSSIDLTNLNSYIIAKVENSRNQDITAKFKEIINLNTSSNAMLISYDKLALHAAELGLSTGKQTFTVTYVVNDRDYPTRVQTFKFTLNNETPKIDCSLDAGEKTTKDFSITFNAGILYEQIGDAYVMINGEVVATINENSSYDVVNITKSFKTDGDGDYYIQLVGTSGNIWLSYKATIKEPLNTWAIIIIIVAVAVVLTVTITIIVLRNKMRIR